VRVTAEGATGVAEGVVGAVGAGEGPDEDGAVAGGGEDEVGVFRGGGDGCDPVGVAGECSAAGEGVVGHGGLIVSFVLGGLESSVCVG